MLALLITETVVVVLLAVLVAGLLRSHADILRALHDLGAGVGDPAEQEAAKDRRSGKRRDRLAGQHGFTGSPHVPVPLQIGPPLPQERGSSSAPDLQGVTPGGDAVVVAVTGVRHLTLLAFLSSGCSSCSGFWRALRDPVGAGLPEGLRVVAVTKGPALELPAEVGSRSAGGVTVVMSSQAWDDYEVPGSPFFVLVDGEAGRRIGEGVANQLSQVADLVSRAAAEAGYGRGAGSGGHRRASLDRVPAASRAIGLGGVARESSNDAELLAAGILPGDPSLYPDKLEDIFASTPPTISAPPTTPASAPTTGAPSIPTSGLLSRSRALDGDATGDLDFQQGRRSSR